MLTNSINACNSACQSCRSCSFYEPEGRRGGICQKLGVLVQAQWKSCNLATPAFISDFHPHGDIALLEKSFSLGCATPKIDVSPQLADNISASSLIKEVNRPIAK